ncbi:MAG TPA: ubiquinol-cytochrome C chaperone family protein [Allosphingosinicella sp.]|nr:ubiquinol-cytochrome C chaperone family protein [Allosphingosinicella sp.]
MSFLSRIFGGRAERETYRPLYDRVVELGRNPAWYRDGQVPDTLDGRFDMVAAVLALVLLRLELEGEATSRASVLIAELFIEDMEGTVRQIGIGDLMVGKHVGRMMGALGGRLSAFRGAIETGEGFEAPVRRNVFHDAPPTEEAASFVSRRLERFWESLAQTPAASVLAGKVPQP